MLLNCGVGEDCCKPLGLQGDPVHLKGDQSWMFIGRTDAEVEAPILWPPDAKKLTYWKRLWCWERLRRGKEDDRGWGLDGIMDSMDMSLSKLREIVKDWKLWCTAVHGVIKSWTRMSDWTELNWHTFTALFLTGVVEYFTSFLYKCCLNFLIWLRDMELDA